MNTPSSALLLNREVLTAPGWTHRYTQDFQYQGITVSAAEIIQSCESSFLKCINRVHSTFGAKEPHILWTSCPKYTAAAPNTHVCAPATSHYNKPQLAYSSTPRQGSPRLEMLSSAANTVSTLPCWVCSPVTPLCQLTSPQGCKWKKRDSSKPPSSAPFDSGGKLWISLFSIPHEQWPSPPAGHLCLTHLWLHEATTNTVQGESTVSITSVTLSPISL